MANPLDQDVFGIKPLSFSTDTEQSPLSQPQAIQQPQSTEVDLGIKPLSFVDQPIEQPVEQPVETTARRNVLMEVPTSLAAGFTDLAEQFAGAYQGSDINPEQKEGPDRYTPGNLLGEFANYILVNKPEFEKKHPYIFAPVKDESSPRRWLREGTRSVVPSLGARIPGAVVGTITGGGPIGLVAGAATSGGTIFGLAEYNRFLRKVDEYNKANPNNQIPDDFANNAAIKQAIFEGGFEGLSDIIEGVSFGWGKTLTTPMKSTIKNILKTGVKENVKQFGKAYGKAVAGEIPTEMAQNYFETINEANTGLETPTTPEEAAISSIGPTAVAVLLIGSGSHALQSRQRSQIQKALTSSEASFDDRFSAMQTIYKELQKTDKVNGTKLADTWGRVAQYKLMKNEPINIEEDVTTMQPLEKVVEGEQRAEQLNTDIAKFDERGQPQVKEEVIPEGEQKPTDDKTVRQTIGLETRQRFVDMFKAKGMDDETSNKLATTIMGAKSPVAPVTTRMESTGILDEFGKTVEKEVPLETTSGTIELSPGESIVKNLPDFFKNQLVFTSRGRLFSNIGSAKAIIKKQGLEKEYAPLELAKGEFVAAPIAIVNMAHNMIKSTKNVVRPKLIVPEQRVSSEPILTPVTPIPVEEYNNVHQDDLSYKGNPYTNKVSADLAIKRHVKQFNLTEPKHKAIRLAPGKWVARPITLINTELEAQKNDKTNIKGLSIAKPENKQTIEQTQLNNRPSEESREAGAVVQEPIQTPITQTAGENIQGETQKVESPTVIKLKEKLAVKEAKLEEKTVKDKLTAKLVTTRLKLGENVPDDLVAKFKTVSIRWARNNETGKWEEKEPGYKAEANRKTLTEEEREQRADKRAMEKAAKIGPVKSADLFKAKQLRARIDQLDSRIEAIYAADNPNEELLDKLEADRDTLQSELDTLKANNISSKRTDVFGRPIEDNTTSTDPVVKNVLYASLESTEEALDNLTVLEPDTNKRMLRKMNPINMPSALVAMINHALHTNDGTVDLSMVKSLLSQLKTAAQGTKLDNYLEDKAAKTNLINSLKLVDDYLIKVSAKLIVDKEVQFARNGIKGNALTVGQVLDQVYKLSGEWKDSTPILVVKDIDSLPEEAQLALASSNNTNVTGAYVNDTIFLVANNISDIDTVQRTVLHELIGHKGVNIILGSEFTSVTVDIFNKYKDSADMQRLISAYSEYDITTTSGQSQLGAEFIAKVAENPAKYDKAIWQQIVDAIKRALNAMGFNFTVDDAYISELLTQSKELIKYGDIVNLYDYLTTDVQFRQQDEEAAKKYGVRFIGMQKLYGKNIEIPMFNDDKVTGSSFLVSEHEGETLEQALNHKRAQFSTAEVIEKKVINFFKNNDTTDKHLVKFITSTGNLLYDNSRGDTFHSDVASQVLPMDEIVDNEDIVLEKLILKTGLIRVASAGGAVLVDTDPLSIEFAKNPKLSTGQLNSIKELLSLTNGKILYDMVNDDLTITSGEADSFDAFKLIITGKKLTKAQQFHTPQYARIVDFTDITPDTPDRQVKDLFNDQAYAILKTLSMQLPKNQPSLAWAERYLLSPEWYDHPTMKQIVRAAIDRHDRYYELFNDLEDGVIEETMALKRKGLSGKDIFLGHSSKDYQLFEKVIDDGDTLAWRENLDPSNPITYIQHLEQTGVPQDVISLYKRHRAAYDMALEKLIEPMQQLVNAIDAKALSENTKPKYPTFTTLDETGKPTQISLKEVTQRMGQLRGTYAPRLREVGDYVIKGKRDNKQVRYHKDSRVTAELLKRDLESKGYTVEPIHEREKLPEDVYASLRIMNTQKAIESAMSNMDDTDPEFIAKFNEELIKEVADVLRMRGYRSSMMARQAGPVVRGYITDPNERFVRYINNISAGIAKSEAAKEMFHLLAGHYEGTGANKKKIGGIDPSKDHRAYETATRYIEEQLRNSDAADRLIGLVKSFATFKYLGANPRTIAVNVLALVTTVPVAIHQHAMGGKGSMVSIGAKIATASKDYLTVMKGKDLADKGEQELMRDIKRGGYDTPQYTRDALGTIQRAHGKAWANTMKWVMYCFGKSEQWIRGTTMLAAYRIARTNNPNMNQHDLVVKAHDVSNKAHGVYGKATQLAVGQGTGPGARLAQLLYTYQKFSHNYLQLLWDAGVRQHNVKALLYGMLSPVILSGVMVFPFKDALLGIIGKSLAILGVGGDPEKSFWDWLRKKFGQSTERVVRHGALGAVNLDVSSSMSIGVGVPRDFYELLGVGGGVLKDYLDATHFLKIGQPLRASEKALPNVIGNAIRAIRELNGVTTSKGHAVFDAKGQPMVPTTTETALRVAGFRSAEQATMGERTMETKREIKMFADKRGDILEMWRNYIITKGDATKLKAVMDAVDKYNKRVMSLNKVGEIPLITKETLTSQAKALSRPSKSMSIGMFNQ